MSQRPAHWSDARPWHTNLALSLIGLAMIGFTRQLVSEYDHFTIGFSGTSSSQLVLYLAAILIFLFKPSNVNRFTFPIILTVAIACRLVVLIPDPVLSSDVYRYAWDGVVQHAHISPYRYVPGDKVLTFLRAPNQDLFDNMNRRDYAHTIYPPAAQIMFYLITFISPTMTFMKLAMVLFEGLTMYGLVKLLNLLGLGREYTILYAWFPMVIWEFAGSGHLDSMVIAFMVLALLFRFRRQPIWTGLFFGVAVLTKFYPIVLLPALYRRREWKMPVVFGAFCAALYLPYLSAGKLVFGFLGGYVQEEGMATGSRYFLLDFAQRLPGLHGLSNAVYLIFAALVLAGLAAWAWFTTCQDESQPAHFLEPALALATAMMLLFSPHYPWYVAWLVPFLVLIRSLTVLTYTLGLFYLCTTALAVGYGPQQYKLNEILYSAVLITFMIELVLRNFPRTREWFRVSGVGTESVLFPRSL